MPINTNYFQQNGNTYTKSPTFPENVEFLPSGTVISVNYDFSSSPNFYYLFGTLVNE